MTTSTTPREHLLAVVEPLEGEDATLALARDVIARGGRATVLMMMTDRIRRDIEDYADCESISLGEAEARIVDHLAADVERRSGGATAHAVFGGRRGTIDVRGYLTADTTVIAVPERLSRSARRLVSRAKVPVVLTPRQAAA